jgi:phage terminase large subunit GpA-like protein
LYSPWKEWGETAAEFLEAKESQETLRTFINTALGEPWDDEAHTSVDLATLVARREHYGPKLPGGVALVTCGVDVQADRLEVELVGWGRSEESWSIAYRVIPGDPTGAAVWAELDEYLQRP